MNREDLLRVLESAYFVLLCIIVLLLASISQGHCQVYENGYVKFTEAEWKTIRNNTINYYFECESKDSIMAVQDSIITIQRQQLSFKDSIIRLYKISLNSSENILHTIDNNATTKEPWLEWEGIYVGLNACYTFTSETAQFFEALKYAGTINVRLRINKYIIEPSYSIPLGNGSGQFNVLFGIRVF